MTTTYSASSRTAVSMWPPFAAVGVGLAALATAIGTFFDVTGNDPGNNDNSAIEYLITLGIIVVAAALVFGLVVRTASVRSAGARSLVLGILGVLSIVVFWAGLPCVLAAGAASCGLAARSANGQISGVGKAGIALAAVTGVAAMLLAFTG
jgi:uncharacterized membrane protein